MSEPNIHPSAKIHPTAVIDRAAKIGERVEIGPYSIVEADVSVGADSHIASHVVMKGPCSIGKNNRIFQFASVGEETPDLKYNGEPTTLTIGDNNIIREGVTLHRGTVQDRGDTLIGNDNLLMAYVHVGHDSVIGNHCILVNNAALAGHVKVEDWAILGGFTLVHQFCNVGAHCFAGMGSSIGKDIPAFMMVTGAPAAPRNINIEGLRRRGFSKDSINGLTQAYKILYRRGLTLEQAIEELTELKVACPEVAVLIDSLNNSTRGIVR